MEIPRSYPLIIAHRGASASAPENTFAAFENAVEAGAEGIEFDVRLAGDGVPVVFHDSDLKRICGIDRKVSKISSKDLGKLDSGSWFNERNRNAANQRFANERIPTLEQTLALLGTYKGIIYIELKARDVNVEELSKAVCKIISNSHLCPQIIVKCFKLQALPLVRKYAPGVQTATLFVPKVMNILLKEKRLINISNDLGAERISLHFSLATRKLIKKAQRKALPVTIWTADNPSWIKRAMRLGIDHVITNSPSRQIITRDALLQKAGS